MSVRRSVRPSVRPSVGPSVGPSVRRSVTHELKSCESAVFNQNYWQYERERILCRVYGLVFLRIPPQVQDANEPEIDEEEEAKQNLEMGRDQIRDFLNGFANMQMESLVKSIRITLDYMRWFIP